jgi:hypothetical protein
VVALDGGADWQVSFVAFSLKQNSLPDDEPPVWDRPEVDTGLLALQCAVLVRDEHPDRFGAAHRALFAVRHDLGQRLTEPGALQAALDGAGLDGADLVRRAQLGEAIPAVRKDHEWAAQVHGAWGVPTVITAHDAVFVRLTNRSDGDAEVSRRTVERVVALVGSWPELNEFKHVRLDQ